MTDLTKKQLREKKYRSAPGAKARQAARQRAWYASEKNKKKQLEASARWRINNPEQTFGPRLRKYWPDLTWQEAIEKYNTMLVQQQYKCAICQKQIEELQTRLVVDHCHTMGRVRGLLRPPCNSQLLVVVENYLDLIPAALQYLGGSK